MIVLNIIILLSYIILWIISRKYQEDFIDKLDEQNYKMKQLYPLGLYLMDKLSIGRVFNKSNKIYSKLDDPLKALFVGERLDLVKRIYLCNKLVLVLLIVFTSNLLALGCNFKAEYNSQLKEGKYIQRPAYNEGTKKVTLDVQVSEGESMVLEDEIQLEIEEKRYNSDELEKMFIYAREYIDSQILNKNVSAENICSNLIFVSRIPQTGLTVKWITADPKLVDVKGEVHNEEITQGVLTWVTAVISYNQKHEEYTRYFKILPKEFSPEERARINLAKALSNSSNQTQTEDILTLPDSLEKQSVVWAEKKDNAGTTFLLLGILAAGFLYAIMDRELIDKVAKRNREMLLDYPEIINKFTLLVGAGMSLSNAWCKISQDYKETGKIKRYAYEEMIITYGELKIGTSETTAYERFGRRVKLLPYLRFSSLIAQNVKKGSVGLLGQLELEAVEAFEERKELAKRMGEEAGTKLLVPMMLMLLIVLAIIMVPAFLSFGI